MIISISLYLLTVAFSYYGNRRLLIKKDWEPDVAILLMIFMPLANIIWGLMSLFASFESSNILKKIFMMK